ncbi:dihydrolipoyl dehydrogenase family protein [Blattabacterium cuenoti]|uniref:dihydrolipoyl dehydrogenase family protein n=1 Tax=Blattabacterium cuenoti TaxID=1653831 RepID=UPI001EE9F33E|nr:FAD-dependent oxidoreductase [Blattabacterium cuenoti]
MVKKSMNFDLIILGSGSAGYAASIRSAQLGMKTALIEKEFIGGFYFNYGYIFKYVLNKIKIFKLFKENQDFLLGLGINDNKINIDFSKIFTDSKNLSKKIKKNMFFSIKKHKINIIHGDAKLKKGKKVEVIKSNNDILECSSSNIIIATGSKPDNLYNGDNFFNYKEAIQFKKKLKEIVIIGSNSIAIEFSFFYHYMGTKVFIIENNNNFFPDGDHEISNYLRSFLKKMGVEIYTSSFVEKTIKKNDRIIIQINNKNKKFYIETDIVFYSNGIIPNIDSIGLEDIGIQVEDKFIVVNDNYQTNIPGYYAIGNVIKRSFLSSVASKEGINCVENIVGVDSQKIDYNNIPKCVHSFPEIAYIGYSEKESKKRGYQVKISKVPFNSINNFFFNEKIDGFIKVIFDSKYDEWLGCHMIGENVINLITSVMIARKLEATAYEILNGIYPYPSLSEFILESVSIAYKKSIYL